jgi:Mn-dependent DtxR family transcriptional regulator
MSITPPTDEDVLRMLAGRILAPSVLAEWLGVSTARMTAQLRRLEAAGLVARRPNPRLVRHNANGAPVFRDGVGFAVIPPMEPAE